jgi:hypothetical protein
LQGQAKEEHEMVKKPSVQYVIVRDSHKEAMVVAIVTAKTTCHWSRMLFLERLIDSITEWINTTKEGTKAWESSGKDFNLGDLSSCCKDKKLVKILAKNGITNLNVDAVENYDESGYWSFDMVLCNTKDLNVELTI